MASTSIINRDDEYWKQSVPCGYWFQPTDEELIIYYLLPKMHGRKIQPGLIRDIDLYKYEPSNLQGLAFNHGDGKMYFFTPLYKKYEKGQKAARRDTALGFWRASQKCTTILNTTIIGSKMPLVYYCKNPKPTKTRWLMYEYKLSKDSKPPGQVQEPMVLEKWVLCVVYYHKTSTKSGDKDNNGNDQDWKTSMAGSSNPNSTSKSQCLIPREAISNSNHANNSNLVPFLQSYCQNCIPFRVSSDCDLEMYLAPRKNLYYSRNAFIDRTGVNASVGPVESTDEVASRDASLDLELSLRQPTHIDN